MEYSNPRLTATITDWPSGSHRVTALFSVETHPTRGQRATRITHHPLTGRPSAPKKLTYAAQVRIVDGEDGRTYIIEKNPHSERIGVMQGNMQCQQETLYPGHSDYARTLALFE